MKLNNLIFTALAGFSIILAGCQNNDENEQHYDNKLFISASNFTKEILFKAGDTLINWHIMMKLQYFFPKSIIQCQKLRLPSNQVV